MGRAERPLDDGDGPLSEFAEDLRQLRVRAGRPAYRELSRRAHYSAAALSEAASGRKLPSLALTRAYVEACGGDTEGWTRRWHDLAAELVAGNGNGDSERAPYVGLGVFQEEDAERFFGRERLVAELVERVARRRFVIVLGPSGSGKSSLLRAGLVHHARTVGLNGSPGRAVVFTPGAHPLHAYNVALAEETADPLVVVDQFEEVFTLGAGRDERTLFLAELAKAANRARIVLGVRADFYAHCAGCPELVEPLRDAQVLVGPMTTEELRAAITQPAIQSGCRLENALVTRLIADATGQPGVLPLVSHALLETWRRRRGNTLTLAGYEEAGGINESIARTAESVFGALSDDQQRCARHLLIRLVALGEGTEDTKRRVDRSELDSAHGAVLEPLARARLITLDRHHVELTHEALVRCWPRLRGWLADDRDGLRVHRQLIEAAGEWDVSGHDNGLLYRGNRLAQADQWAASSGDGALTTREREFLQASLAARSQERATARRRRRQLRRLLALLSVLLVITTGTTGYALQARHTAAEQRNLAITRNVISEADALRAANPALAMQLSLAAYRLTGLPEARGSVLTTLTAPYAVRLTGHTDQAQAVAFSPDGRTLATAGDDKVVRLWELTPAHPRQVAVLAGYFGLVYSVAFSPDGHTLAALGVGAGQHSAVRLWDVTRPAEPRELPAPAGSGSPFGAVGFSPDGRTLASGGVDVSGHGVLRLWDVRDPARTPPAALVPAGAGAVQALAFSPDGRLLATANVGPLTEVRLWDLSSPGEPRPLSTLTASSADAVRLLAFSPDSRTLVTGQYNDDIVSLWDISDPVQPQALAPLTGFAGVVYSVAFSPDGHTMATGSADRTIRLWDLTNVRRPHVLTTLTGTAGAVHALAFSPDGRTLAMASADSVVRLADVGEFLFPVREHGYVQSVGFAPDGRTLVAGHRDGTMRLWDTADPYRPRALALIDTGSKTETLTAVFGPSGDLLATSNTDGLISLWDAGFQRLASVADRGASPALSLAFSPNGRVLITGHLDHTARLWDVTDRRHPAALATLNGFSANVYSLAVTGNLLVTGSDQPTSRLWDISDPRQPRALAVLGVGGSLQSASFAPDGRTLATASFDHTVALWNVADPRQPRLLSTLTGPTAAYSVNFSQDGRTLATTRADHTATLFDVTDPKQPKQLAALTAPAATTTTAFSQTNRVLAIATADRAGPGSAPRLWDTDIERVAARICELAWPTITRAEWDHYLPGIPYQPPCA